MAVPKVGEFAAVIYENKLYLTEIKEVISSDVLKVTFFLTKGRNKFLFPSGKDEAYETCMINKVKVISKVPEPMLSGRFVELPLVDFNHIENVFTQILKN